MPSTYCRSEASPGAAVGEKRTVRGWLRLAGCAAAIGLIWLGVLPWIADRPSVQRQLEFLDQRQIDPSAMFYTELEAMDDVRDHMTEVRQQHGSAFWRPQTGWSSSGKQSQGQSTTQR